MQKVSNIYKNNFKNIILLSILLQISNIVFNILSAYLHKNGMGKYARILRFVTQLVTLLIIEPVTVCFVSTSEARKIIREINAIKKITIDV